MNYYLSAFITPARSVMQYIFASAEQRQRLKEYNGMVSGNTVLKFFKEERDFNIHKAPIIPNKLATVDIAASITVGMKEEVKIELINGEDYKEIVSSIESVDNLDNVEETIDSKVQYFFDKWKGEEDLVELCDKYILELEKMIREALDLKIIN